MVESQQKYDALFCLVCDKLTIEIKDCMGYNYCRWKMVRRSEEWNVGGCDREKGWV